jgi:two-component system, LytTR family, sensor kinase
MRRMTRRRLSRAAAILGGWTCIALLFAPQNYFANRLSPTPLPAWAAILASASLFIVWAVLTPLVIALARRFPFRRGRILLSIVQHLLLSAGVTVLHMAGLIAIQSTLPVPEGHVPPMPPELMLATIVATNVMLYWSILAVATAVAYFRRDQERELALVQAQLQSLRSRLEPHFLFNTLNAIAELMYEDTRRAEETLTQLSDVLRLTLQHDQAHEITLAEELDLLRKHVAIYQTLLHDRLRVRWSIEERALEARVPTMILQPLVENAIRHGIAPRESGGMVGVTARRDGAFLCLTVEDDGVGMRDAGGRTGIGLTNTRARLRFLYGDAYRFEMSEPAGGGTAVAMRLPLR